MTSIRDHLLIPGTVDMRTRATLRAEQTEGGQNGSIVGFEEMASAFQAQTPVQKCYNGASVEMWDVYVSQSEKDRTRSVLLQLTDNIDEAEYDDFDGKREVCFHCTVRKEYIKTPIEFFNSVRDQLHLGVAITMEPYSTPATETSPAKKVVGFVRSGEETSYCDPHDANVPRTDHPVECRDTTNGETEQNRKRAASEAGLPSIEQLKSQIATRKEPEMSNAPEAIEMLVKVAAETTNATKRRSINLLEPGETVRLDWAFEEEFGFANVVSVGHKTARAVLVYSHTVKCEESNPTRRCCEIVPGEVTDCEIMLRNDGAVILPAATKKQLSYKQVRAPRWLWWDCAKVTVRESYD